MPRRKHTFTPGHTYHIYNRGAHRARIFFSDDNYRYCLRLLKKYGRKYQITIIAYCLMPNHYHLLLRQDGDTSLSHFISVLFNAYVQAINRQTQHSGTLFAGRFRAVHVDKEGYLLHLCRYIHANPVKAGLAATPADWPYANYLEWMGALPGTLVDVAFIDHYFPERQAYAAFVRDYLLGTDPPPEGVEPYLLG